ncbi:hypothetical protein AB0I39_05205 [Kitasatospora purpeofusca]|uniref:hypothetical protein n=1 Tax=Kitasatospora purpeofusca TaxID=67352 RepID=UPI0033FF9E72
MNGPLRITVLDKDAYYEQRAVVRTPYGTFVLEGRAGASLDVRAEEWELELQHCVPGVGWRPNVRVLPYPWQTSGGLRSRIVRSKDCDWPNGDPTERNFVLRLSATVAERPGAAPAAAEAVGPAVRGVLRTSSGAGLGTVGGAVPGVPATPGAPVVPGVPAAPAMPAVSPAPAAGPVPGVRAAEAAQRSYLDAVPAEAGRLATGRVAPAVWPAPTARAVQGRALEARPLQARPVEARPVEAERAAPVAGGEARESWVSRGSAR